MAEQYIILYDVDLQWTRMRDITFSHRVNSSESLRINEAMAELSASGQTMPLVMGSDGLLGIEGGGAYYFAANNLRWEYITTIPTHSTRDNEILAAIAREYFLGHISQVEVTQAPETNRSRRRRERRSSYINDPLSDASRFKIKWQVYDREPLMRLWKSIYRIVQLHPNIAEPPQKITFNRVNGMGSYANENSAIDQALFRLRRESNAYSSNASEMTNWLEIEQRIINAGFSQQYDDQAFDVIADLTGLAATDITNRTRIFRFVQSLSPANANETHKTAVLNSLISAIDFRIPQSEHIYTIHVYANGQVVIELQDNLRAATFNALPSGSYENANRWSAIRPLFTGKFKKSTEASEIFFDNSTIDSGNTGSVGNTVSWYRIAIDNSLEARTVNRLTTSNQVYRVVRHTPEILLLSRTQTNNTDTSTTSTTSNSLIVSNELSQATLTDLAEALGLPALNTFSINNVNNSSESSTESIASLASLDSEESSSISATEEKPGNSSLYDGDFVRRRSIIVEEYDDDIKTTD